MGYGGESSPIVTVPDPPRADAFGRFSDDMLALLRRVLIVGLGIGGPVILVLIVVKGPRDPVIRFGFPPLLAYLLVYAWVLLRRPRLATRFSRVTLWGIDVVWLGGMVYRLVGEDLAHGWRDLFPTTVMGFVVFLVVGFMVFPVRAAVVHASLLIASVAGVGAVCLVSVGASVDELIDLVRYCTYLVVLAVLLHLLSRTRARVDLAFSAAEQASNEAHEMRDMAYRDPLTTVANRRRLVEELAFQSGLVDRRHPVSVVYFDLDHFKAVNDVHGHAVGDRVLVAVAHLASTLVRQQDLVARIGGEEFVIVTPGVDGGTAVQLAERLRSVLPAALELAVGFPVTASLGVSTLRPGESALDILDRVDALMYEAKTTGRDRVVYVPS